MLINAFSSKTVFTIRWFVEEELNVISFSAFIMFHSIISYIYELLV